MNKWEILRRAVHILGGAVLGFGFAGIASANPNGGEVVQGSAQIQPINPTLLNVVQNSERAVINWTDFSVNSGERVNFQQPGASSAVLNRVIGPDLSVIAGQISANGQVFISNPQGLVFTEGSTVDVNRFVATTANIGDSAFMAGDLSFNQASPNAAATIRVEDGATILAGGTSAAEAGLVALVAPGVEHAGIIQANFGEVVIGGAQTFTLDLNGDGLVSFALADAVGEALVNGAVVDVSGDIVSEGGTILIDAVAATGLVGTAINLSGRLFARSAGVDGQGNIVLQSSCADGAAGCGDIALASNSLIDAAGDGSGETGGDITISGNGIAASSGAVINANGTDGGGTVMVESAGLADLAGQVFADGGSIALVADEAEIAGQLFARDGGTVAIDGSDLVIATGGAIDVSGDAGGSVRLGDENTSTLNVAGSVFADGSEGTITATSDSISVDGFLLARSTDGAGGTVTLAGETLEVAGAVDVSGTAGGSVTANSSSITIDGQVFADANTGAAGTITATADMLEVNGELAARSGTGSGGTVALTGTTLSTGADSTIETTGASGGAVTLTGTGTEAQLTVDGEVTAGTEAGGAVTLSAADGRVEIGGTVVAGGAGQLTVTAADVEVMDDASLSSSGASGGSVIVNATDDLMMNGAVFAEGSEGNGGTISLASTNNLIAGGSLSTTGAGQSGSVTVSGSGDYVVSSTIAAGAATFNYDGDQSLTLGSADGTPEIEMDTTNSALQNGAMTIINAGGEVLINSLVDGRPADGAGGSLVIDATGAVTIAGDCDPSPCGVALADADLGITSGGTIEMQAGSDQFALLSLGSGDLILNATGDITTQDIVTAGAVLLDARNGNVLIERELGGAEGSDNPSIGSLTINSNVADGEEGDVTLNAIRTNADGSVTVARALTLNVDGQIDSGGVVDLNGETIYLRRSLFTSGDEINLSAQNMVYLEPTGPVSVEQIDVEGGFQGGPFFYFIPSREITLSTGANGDGDITVNGEVDVSDSPLCDDPYCGQGSGSLGGPGYTLGFFTFSISNDVEDSIQIDAPVFCCYDPNNPEDYDPPGFYVTLNIDSGNGTTRFVNGIAASRVNDGHIYVPWWGGVLLLEFSQEEIFPSLPPEDPLYPGEFRRVFGVNSVNLVLQSGQLEFVDTLVVNDLINMTGLNDEIVFIDRFVGHQNSLCGNNVDCLNSSLFPDANYFRLFRVVVEVDGPPTEPTPGNFSQPVVPSIGSNIVSPNTISVPGIGGAPSAGSVASVPDVSNPGGSPGSGGPGSVSGLDDVVLPTGSAPDSIDEVQGIDAEGVDDTTTSSAQTVGGSGVGKDADVGQDPGISGAAPDVFGSDHHVVAGEDCVQTDSAGNCVATSETNDYLQDDVYESVQGGAQ